MGWTKSVGALLLGFLFVGFFSIAAFAETQGNQGPHRGLARMPRDQVSLIAADNDSSSFSWGSASTWEPFGAALIGGGAALGGSALAQKNTRERELELRSRDEQGQNARDFQDVVAETLDGVVTWYEGRGEDGRGSVALAQAARTALAKVQLRASRIADAQLAIQVSDFANVVNAILRSNDESEITRGLERAVQLSEPIISRAGEIYRAAKGLDEAA